MIKSIQAKKKQLVAKERTKEDQIRLKRELHKAEKNHDPFCKICSELEIQMKPKRNKDLKLRWTKEELDLNKAKK